MLQFNPYICRPHIIPYKYPKQPRFFMFIAPMDGKVLRKTNSWELCRKVVSRTTPAAVQRGFTSSSSADLRKDVPLEDR